MNSDLFNEELRIFWQHRDEWLQTHPGAFVAIQGTVIADGFFPEYADAFRAGLERFGVTRPYLVKQVWSSEPVYFVS